MFVIINAPHFYAAIDFDSDNYAPILRYMRGWSITDILNYCKKKGWKIESIN